MIDDGVTMTELASALEDASADDENVTICELGSSLLDETGISALDASMTDDDDSEDAADDADEGSSDEDPLAIDADEAGSDTDELAPGSEFDDVMPAVPDELPTGAEPGWQRPSSHM